MSVDKSVSTRLAKALKYLEMARTSRELAFSAVPYTRAAEMLIQTALDEQRKQDGVSPDIS